METKRKTKPSNGRSSRIRCAWPSSAISVAYHDREWGVPLKNERKLFEFLVLDAMQAGLELGDHPSQARRISRRLRRFRSRKDRPLRQAQIRPLLADPGIIRNRLKIESTITNARAFLASARRLWQLRALHLAVRRRRAAQSTAVRSLKEHSRRAAPESDAMSKALKKRGFRFVGSTICYAFMQAAGMVNDHLVDCFRHGELAAPYATLENPRVPRYNEFIGGIVECSLSVWQGMARRKCRVIALW